MQAIRDTVVESGCLALWWLGQSGFVFKTPAAAIFSVDAYLTNSCAAVGRARGLNLERSVPIFIAPSEFAVDYFICTHSHQDHADPDTISRLPKEHMRFVGPGLTCELFDRCGVPAGQIQQLYPGGHCRFSDVILHGAFALPTDGTDLDHIGLLIEIAGGPRVYVTGDTAYNELLAHVAKLKPHALIACINGGFNNLSAWQAAQIATLIQPRVAIPCHYDMFPDNRADPEMFRAALHYRAPEIQYCRLDHMTKFVLRVTESGACGVKGLYKSDMR